MDATRWKKIKDVAADAIELDHSKRADFIKSSCSGDVRLQHAVERLVHAHDGRDSLLDVTGGTRSKRTPGSEPRVTSTDGSQIPAELLERSARRLATLAALYAAGFTLGYALYEIVVHAVGGGPYDQAGHTPGQVMLIVFVGVALAVAGMARGERLQPMTFMRLGLGFEVFGSLGIALISHSGPWPTEAPIWGISWICVWIMVFPLIVPGPPRLAGIAGFTSAAMGPLAMVIWSVARATPLPSFSTFAAVGAPNFVCAGLALLAARYIYRIGVELHEAKKLGSYRLVRRIGLGGMGEVWIAEHDLLARPAALKLVRPELLEAAVPFAEVTRRFEREAQSTAALTSPHTVTLYDFGLNREGLFYYVMELLDGVDLETLVRRFGPVPADRAIHIMLQVCESLAEAHERGLVHRDIKPSNVFLCRQGTECDFVKVLDFGIVRQRTDLEGRDRATEALRVEGTPGYMAPEAIREGAADPRTDLYALGCVGFWLLTGREVFGGRNPRPGMAQHLSDMPVPPSTATELEVPPALDAAILSCLDKDPAKRPASADELTARLATIRGGQWTAWHARNWWDLHLKGSVWEPAGGARGV